MVHFEGEQLWQGANDATVITLLKDEHEGIKIKRRSRKSLIVRQDTFGHGWDANTPCSVCGKRVYQNEYVGASGRTFHKACFRCATCNKQLSMTDYSVSADFKPRCTKCHVEHERQRF